MQHRIFIAVNLPENIKKKLADYENKWLELPCRWTRKENLHITLAFLGYLPDEELVEVCNIARETALKHDPFFINLNKIIYGPRTGPPATQEGLASRPQKLPRMVWAEGEKSEELGKLQKDLENSLTGLSSELQSEKGRGYTPHITLGRIKEWEFRKIEPEERPEVNEETSLDFEVSSVEVMESQLKRGGPEYSILESCPLKS